ncbi:MAG: thioredoxin-disulfide reductase [Clostridium sp.]|nr:thioredoxin-disulfide reductase [Clostridium sp.]
MYDVVIIGSGPAGLSAAVYAKRAMLNVLVLEKEPFNGGQIVKTEQVDNYLGLNGINGFDMAMKFKEHADALGVSFREGTVSAIEDTGADKMVRLANGEVLAAKTVVIATGARHKMLGAEGEQEFTGAGVSYCATCDGAFYRGKDVAVVGGGDVALGDALYLAKGCNRVYLIHRRDGFRAARSLQARVQETENIEFLPFYEVKKIMGNDMAEEVLLTQNQTGEERSLAVSGLFIAVGMEPETAFVKDTVKTDEAGYVVAGEDCKTSADGIFAAGDVRTKPVRQIATAVADGANAAASIEQYLG